VVEEDEGDGSLFLHEVKINPAINITEVILKAVFFIFIEIWFSAL
jgi:hypothetical protein